MAKPTPIMWLFNGRDVDLERPSGKPFADRAALARSLAHQARFLGHTVRHYSVAEHLVHCAAVAPRRFMRPALLHDVHEAICGDVTRPWKCVLPDYRAAEHRWQLAAYEEFDLWMDPETQVAISVIDRALCATELVNLMRRGRKEAADALGVSPLPLRLEPQVSPHKSWSLTWLETLNQLEDEDTELPDVWPQYVGHEMPLKAARRQIATEIKERVERMNTKNLTPAEAVAD